MNMNNSSDREAHLGVDSLEAVRTALATAAPAPEMDELIPEGKYVASALKADFKRSKNKGTLYYEVDCKICDGPYRGRHLWIQLYCTVRNAPYLRRDLAKLGIDDPDGANHTFPGGLPLELNVVVEAGEDGVLRNQVQSFLRLNREPAALTAE